MAGHIQWTPINRADGDASLVILVIKRRDDQDEANAVRQRAGLPA